MQKQYVKKLKNLIILSFPVLYKFIKVCYNYKMYNISDLKLL